MNRITTDYGKVAYAETQNLHRKLATQTNAFYHQTKKVSKHNFLHTGGELLHFSFEANWNVPITLQLTASSAVTQPYTVTIFLNQAKLFSQTVQLSQWNQTFFLFAYHKNQITVEVVNETEMEFTQFELTVQGEFGCDQISYNQMQLETNNQTGEITLLCSHNNVQHLFSFANLEQLFNEFTTNQNSPTTIQLVWQLLMSKVKTGSSYYDDSLFVLKQKNGQEGLFVSNLAGSLETKVSETVPNHAILLSQQNTHFAFVVYLLNGLTLTLLGLNASLQVVFTQELTLPVKNNVKQLVPIFVKDTTENLQANFLVVTTQNDVFLLTNTFYPELNMFRMGLTSILLGKGSQAYGVFQNHDLHCFLVNTNHEVTHSEFEHIVLNNQFKRKKTTENCNAQLGYYHPSGQAFYLYDDHFSWSAEHD